MDDDEDYQARWACHFRDGLTETRRCRRCNPGGRSSPGNAGKCHDLQLQIAFLCLAAQRKFRSGRLLLAVNRSLQPTSPGAPAALDLAGGCRAKPHSEGFCWLRLLPLSAVQVTIFNNHQHIAVCSLMKSLMMKMRQKR